MTELPRNLLDRGLPAFGSGWGLARASTARSEPAAGPAALAYLLDQLAFPSEAAGPLRQALQTGEARDLASALARLSAAQRDRLRSQLSGSSLEELIAISRENDGPLFAEALLLWAQREEVANRLPTAGLVYQFLSQREAGGEFLLPGAPEALRRRATERLDAMQGRGAIGNRVEFLSRRLAQEASDPVMIAGMATGSLVFSTARTAFLSRLLATPGRSAVAARALASTGAFALEVPAFWATTNGLHEAIAPGSQAWDLRSNLREISGLALTLGALKLSGALASGLSRRLASTPNPALMGSGERLAHGVLHQGGMLGGILLGHRLEEAAGLRPHVDGATTMVDSLAMLLQFHVGGRLSHHALGPRFQAYTQDLEMRGRLLEQQALAEGRARLGAGLRDFFDGGAAGGLVPAAATAGTGRGRRGADGMAEARSHIAMMSMDPEGPRDGAGFTMELPAPAGTARRAAQEPKATLPERRGNTVDSLNNLVDRFEPEIAPPKLIRLLPEPVQAEILQQIRFSRENIGQINEQHFGRGLGLALQARMREIHEGLSRLSLSEPMELLPENLQGAIRAADEMVNVVEYLPRSNQRRILNTLWESVDPDIYVSYPEFKRVLVDLLGPHFAPPSGEIARGSEVLQPHQAVLSIGSGDMMGLLALYRHQIRPGGHSWRTRLFVNARQPQVANEINEHGTYEANTNLRGMRINYAQDPKIVAVGPQGYEGITREMLQRTVRLQLLNVPSDKLHEVLTPEYIRGLPENAVLLEVIGGFIGPEKRGPYQAAPGDRRTILPYQFINQALRANGREDVRVVSGGGYIPGKFLWRGQPVEMVFAGPEVEDSHRSPEAELVTYAFTGPSRDNGFLRADFTHHQHSTELGKAAKNVTTLIAGEQSVSLARQMMDGATDVAQARGRFEAEIREPLFGLMEGLLVYNEVGINPLRARYRLEVRNDFWRCSEISMEEVFRVVDLARRIDVNQPEAMRQFLNDHVVNNPRIATTRNPKRGIAQGIVAMWREMGSPYRPDELLPRKPDGSPAMTQEGVNSLPPLMEYYNFERHPIEHRRLAQPFYEAFGRFFPTVPLTPPPVLPEFVRRALRGDILMVREANLRRALEGKSERGLMLLDGELGRLAQYQARPSTDENNDAVARQLEVVRALKAAMLVGTPQRLMRSPIIRPPYGNMFIIKMMEPNGRRDSYRAFIRVDGRGVMNRITQMGMFLRSFPEGARVYIEIETTGLDPRRNAAERGELEYTLQQILTAFRQVRPADEVEITVNQRRIVAGSEYREPVSGEYFQALNPLVNRLQGLRGEAADSAPQESAPPKDARWLVPGPRELTTANQLRNAAAEHAQVLDNFLQGSQGWPMILGYFGGPLNSAIKSAFTRPERGTIIGVYDGGRLVDAFSVYRASDNRPRVLSHHLLSRLKSEFKENPEYQDLASADYFDGMPLGSFLRDFERYSSRIERGPLEYRIIPLRSLPIEEALAGKVEGINPALLRLFLEQPEDFRPRREMLSELAPLYERPTAEVHDQVREVLSRYLDPFYQEHREMLDAIPIFQFFERNGPGAISRLTRNGEEHSQE